MEKEQFRMQMLAGIITEDEYKAKLMKETSMSGMTLIKKLTPEMQAKIEQLQKEYPNHKFTLTPNDRWKPDRKDLRGTYTLSYSGPSNDILYDIIQDLKKL
jgi:hypothetical protein